MLKRAGRGRPARVLFWVNAAGKIASLRAMNDCPPPRAPSRPTASLALACFLLFAAGSWECAAGWVVETVAGDGVAGYSGDGGLSTKARINNPYGVALGPDGALYFCEIGNHVIRRAAKDGVISTVAGTGAKGWSGDGGPALKAALNEPYEIRFDRGGAMVFVEMRNHLIRRVGPDGVISTLAGGGGAGFEGDGGPATQAKFNQPHSIQFDAEGNLWICDIGNHRLRRIEKASGLLATQGGTGERKPTPDGSRLSGTPLNGPRAVDFGPDGAAWLALREGNQIVRVDPGGNTVRRVAGTGVSGFSGNGGPSLEATLSGPKGISVGPDGNVYFADTESHSVRRINIRTGVMELVAGDGKRGDGPDGPAGSCRLNRPHGVFAAPDGVIYVGDSENHRVRAIRWVD